MRLINKTWFAILAFSLCLTQTVSAAGPPFNIPAKGDLSKLKSAVVKTTKGDIYVDLYPNDAPWHVANFKFLADKNFYQGSVFHIHKQNYIIQGGGPAGKPTGSPGWDLQPEFNERAHLRGTLGMARKGDVLNPSRESSGSQFHLLLRRAPHMDGSYTVFGQVVHGYDVLDKLEEGDSIFDVIVYVRNPKPGIRNLEPGVRSENKITPKPELPEDTPQQN